MSGVLEDRIVQQVAEMLGVDALQVDCLLPLSDSGLSSLQLLELSDWIQREARVELEPTIVFDHPTIAALADFVADEIGRQGVARQGTPTR